MQTVRKWKRDVAVLSEPYKQLNCQSWVSDATGRAVIWACGKLPFQDTIDETQNGFVRAKLGNIHVYSCYAPPSLEDDEFQDLLDRLVRDAKERSPLVIAGDFNSWSVDWGSKWTNRRGIMLLEAMSILDVVLLNSGNTPTYEKEGLGASIVDLTFVSTNLSSTNGAWKVNDIFNLSDHRVIGWAVSTKCNQRKSIPKKMTISRGWKVKMFEPRTFLEALNSGPIDAGNAREEADEVIVRIVNACDSTMPRKSSTNPHPPVYWWNENIAELRKMCIQARRTATRGRRKPNYEALRAAYKEARGQLAKAIRSSKSQCWTELLEKVESDPWGKPYKVVMKQLKNQPMPTPTCPELLLKIVTKLFPQRTECNFRIEENRNELIPLVTSAELKRACAKIANQKAPGPDGIPNIALKTAVRAAPEMFLRMYNRCLQEGDFPTEWKKQRLVLLPKGKKPPDDPSSYRPLCLLDTAGKILERIIYMRIEELSESYLSDRQYGFRKGRSTTDAINLVVDTAKDAISGKRWKNGEKQYCAVVTLDMENAFNSAKWDRIMEALQKMGTPKYLLKVIASYFSDRVLLYDTEDGPKEYKVTGGVPQGSVLGPLLWNIMYDGLLKLPIPRAVTPVGFADDIGLVIVVKYLDEIQKLLDIVLREYCTWMELSGQKLAEHKTEFVLITSRKKIETITLRVGEHIITSQPSVRYLGVQIDARLRFKEQALHACTKASSVVGVLSRLMPNVRGPKQKRRALLGSVVSSVLTYGIAVWADALNCQDVQRRLFPVHRRSALRVAGAFRTVSREAAHLIAGVMPIEVLAQERRMLYQQRNEILRKDIKTEERRRSVKRWQKLWDESVNGRWTHRLIPQVDVWINRSHGEVSYHLTQMLSGHGCFRAYLYKYKYEDSPYCPSCGDINEDAEHVFFVCPRFKEERTKLECMIGRTIAPETLMRAMLTSEEAWKAAAIFATEVIQCLRQEERLRREVR